MDSSEHKHVTPREGTPRSWAQRPLPNARSRGKRDSLTINKLSGKDVSIVNLKKLHKISNISSQPRKIPKLFFEIQVSGVI